MPKLEIQSFSEDFRDAAAALLAERHRRHPAAEPLLAEVEDFAAQIPAGHGAVATRGGDVVAYVVADVGEERAAVGLAGSITTDWRSVNLLSSRFWPRRGFRPTFLRLYRAVP